MAQLLQNLHLKKRERDLHLERLSNEGLVWISGDQVKAKTFSEFVSGLYASDEFPGVDKRQGARG